MAAYGVVIACLAGHRGLMVYIVMMAPYAYLVAADAQNAAKYPEQREASGTMPDPYTAEFASTAEAFALTAFVFLSLLVWRQDRARAKHDDASSPEAP